MPILFCYFSDKLQEDFHLKPNGMMGQIYPEMIFIFRSNGDELTVAERVLFSDFECVTGITVKYVPVVLKFTACLKTMSDLIAENTSDLWYVWAAGCPIEFLLSAYVLQAFYDIRFVHSRFIVPNQAMLVEFSKNIKLLKIIEKHEPKSLEELGELTKSNGIYKRDAYMTKKNLRAKLSYEIGKLRNFSLVSTERAERGKLVVRVAKLGKELLRLGIGT